MKTTVKADELRTLNSKENLFELGFHTFQQINTKKDSEEHKRTLFVGLFNAKSVLTIPQQGNVRDYLKKGKDGKNKVTSGNHAQIYTSLLNKRDEFHFLNGGITITADSIYSRDNNNKKIVLLNPQIINGAQTRGVLKTFFNEYKDAQVLVKIELILSSSASKNQFFDDISIARNQQTAVKLLSIAGKRGLLDKLDEVTSKALKKNESQGDKYDTEKLIQLIFAIMPESILEKAFPKRKDLRDRSFIYSSKATIFKKFIEIAETEKPNDNSILFDFIHEISDDVQNLYDKIRSNQFPLITRELDSLSSFKGKGYKISSSKNGSRKLTILDGVIFPIFACMSILVEGDQGSFSIVNYNDDILQQITKNIITYSNIDEHNNVQTLGKSKSSYTGPSDFFKVQRGIPLANL